MTTYNLDTPVTGLKYQAKQTENGGSVFVKNAVIAYVLTSSACTKVTDIDYPARHTYAVTSITRASSTATVTTTATNSLVTGDSVTIAGASQADYNGTFTITVTSGTTFTYTVANAPATPATGTITATGGKTTVPGVVYMDGYIFVMTIQGAIQNCDNGDVTSWNALAFITPEKEPSNAVYLGKSINYVVAFKDWDTEFFYNAAIAAPASPLAPVDSSYLKLGCATADSVVEFDGGIVFMSKRDNLQRSREIHVLNGLTPKKISTPEVERILNGDDLSECYALYLSTAGHQFYVLTMIDSLITIVYDFNNGLWYQWTFLTIQSQKSVTSLTSSSGVATAAVTAHGYADGDPVLIAGATPSDYNGIFNITRVDANTFTYPVASGITTPATGTLTSKGYDESYYPAVGSATYQNMDLVLHKANGIIYSLETDTYQDNGVPINTMIRTPNWDNGNNDLKHISQLRIIGDRVDGDALVRDYDDDYVTASKYRRLDMSNQFSKLTRLGSPRRRAIEVRYTENTAFRVDAIDMEFKQGR